MTLQAEFLDPHSAAEAFSHVSLLGFIFIVGPGRTIWDHFVLERCP